VTKNSGGNSRLVEDNWRMEEDWKYEFECFQKWFPGVAAGAFLNSITGVVIKFYYNTWMKRIMILSKYADEEY